MKRFDILIDKNSKTPIYKQIYECIKIKIDRAELVENTKLPSIRQLSIKLKINNLTILKAYNLLESENYIYKKQGLGVFVKKKDMILYFTPPKEIIESFKYHEADYNKFIDFVSGSPSKDIFPYDEFKKITQKVFEKYGAEMLGYHDSQGYKKLRCYLSQCLKRKGIDIADKNIQITSGSQQGIELILKTLLSKRKNKIVVGNPTYHGAINNFKKECKVYGVSMKKDGFNMDELEEILATENISFIYTMIDFQSPTGISWSNEKKRKLINLAEQYNTYIVQDDCLSEIYYDKTPPVLLKTFDKENKHVIYIKSFSKLLMPGLRLGYMVVPDELINKVVTAKFTSDISSSGFEQRILLEFLKGNYLNIHLDELRKIYRERYKHIMNLLKDSNFLKVIYPIKGGFYLWIELPVNINSNIFYIKCKKKGISILPGSVFFLKDIQNNYFRLSFASANKEEITEGIAKMEQIIKEMF